MKCGASDCYCDGLGKAQYASIFPNGEEEPSCLECVAHHMVLGLRSRVLSEKEITAGSTTAKKSFNV